MSISKQDTISQFGRMSEAYVASLTHSKNIDLDVILLLLAPTPEMRVLDIATGGGHTALKIAPYVREVVASDLTPQMIDRVYEQTIAKGVNNITTVIADAEELPFVEGEFDAVTCRIAPHHFFNIRKAMKEISRVLKKDGVFILEDSLSPLDAELDTFINHIEVVRDPTHIRSYNLTEWNEFVCAAGLSIQETLIYRKGHDIKNWLERAGVTDSITAEVYALFRRAPQAAKEHFQITNDAQEAIHYVDDKVILKMRKSS